MEDLIIYGASALFGGLLGWLFASALERYWKKAQDWFESVWNDTSRARRAVGVFVRRSGRLFKEFWVELTNGVEEHYHQPDDEGVEVNRGDLSDEINEALDRQEFIAVWSKGM